MSDPQTSTRWFGMSLRDRISIALVAALIVAAKFYLRVPLRIPGHSGLFWMALLIIGTGIIRRPGAGTLIGLISGILAVFVVPGRQGVFTGVKYLAPGIVVDVLGVLLATRYDRYVVSIIAGAAANIAKLASAYVVGLLAGIPAGYLAVGLGFAASTHLVFGAAGGWIAAVIIRQLDRAGVVRKLPAPAPAREVAS